MAINVEPAWKLAEQEFDCRHEHVSAVRYTDSIGRLSVRKQCQMCGAHRGDEKKDGYDLSTLPAWDEGLREAWNEARSLRRLELTGAQIQAQQADSRQAYREYLRSPQWNRVKRAVLDRDKYTCQNCFRKVAPNLYPMPDRAEVHHKHYTGLNRVGESFAFECVTLCHDCHRRYHGTEVGEDE